MFSFEMVMVMLMLMTFVTLALELRPLLLEGFMAERRLAGMHRELRALNEANSAGGLEPAQYAAVRGAACRTHSPHWAPSPDRRAARNARSFRCAWHSRRHGRGPGGHCRRSDA